MAVLTAAVVVVAALCLLNLAVSTALIHRLRDGQDMSGRQAPGAGIRAPGGLPPGSVPPTLPLGPAGGPRTVPAAREALRGRLTLVGFYAGGCEECRRHAPGLAARAADLAAAGVQVVTAVIDTGPRADALAEVLRPAGLLLTGPEAADLATGFAVDATPVSYLIGPEGTVLAAAPTLADLPLPLAPARPAG